MAIEKQIWIDVIKEGMYPESSFLTESVDMSEFVDYNKINLAEAGVDPSVLVDNTVFPVPTVSRTDVPKEIPLHTFDTVNTVVRNVEEKETAYNKMDSVVRGHRNALRLYDGSLAANNWAPAANTALTPVIASTGALNAYTLKKLTFEDVLDLESKFMMIDANMDELVLLLNPIHLGDLKSQDIKLYKEFMTDRKLFSFKLYTYSKNPYYTAAGAKKAFGSTPAGTDTMASIAWMRSEVMKCEGDYEVFAKYKDPGERGDVIGFQQRFHAMPIRNKYIGAIRSGA